MLKLIALVIPLGLDTFAVAAALGVAGVTRRSQLRLSAVFMVFEGGMPIVGLLIGLGLSKVLGGIADVAAIVVLIGAGIYLLVSDDEGEARLGFLAKTRGPALLALGLSISLDELAIGLTLGLVKVPLIPAVVAIAIQAFVVSQIGFRLGSKVGEGVREGAERIAGLVLILLGVAVVVTRMRGIPF